MDVEGTQFIHNRYGVVLCHGFECRLCPLRAVYPCSHELISPNFKPCLFQMQEMVTTLKAQGRTEGHAVGEVASSVSGI